MQTAISVAPQWFSAFTDYQGFLDSKSRDKSWEKLPDKLFNRIYKNAGGDIESIRSFLMISSQFNLLNISYSPLIKLQKRYRDFVLHTLISHALLNIGRTYLDNDLAAAEQYLKNALLCDEYCIQAYPALAACYKDKSFDKEKITALRDRFNSVIKHYQYDKLNTKQREYFVNEVTIGKIKKGIEKLASKRA